MDKNLSWYERYQIALKESLTIKDIMKLRCCGQPRAIKIRDEAVEYCVMNNIEMEGSKVPCEVVMIITDKDLQFYYDKMVLEIQSQRLKQELAHVSA